MTDKQTYAFMAAAAYDERRGNANDEHIAPKSIEGRCSNGQPHNG